MGGLKKQYVAALDVGTTSVRCHVFDERIEPVGRSSQPVKVLSPKPGHMEINPDDLWNSILSVIPEAVQAAGLTLDGAALKGLGICTQRSTFITWDKHTGIPFHNLITWQDFRAEQFAHTQNSSFIFKVSIRLAWEVRTNEMLREALRAKTAMFGTMDTWILYKLTQGKLHVTEPSNASATALYDPYAMDWGMPLLHLLGIQNIILPQVWDTVGNFGNTAPGILPFTIPIVCVIGDQSASLFGNCCFKKGDLKLTLGTGGFLNTNTGNEPISSVFGIFPVVAWKIGSELTYMAEGMLKDVGTVMEWASRVGLVSEPKDTGPLAEEVPDAHGVCFIPAFAGLQAPLDDDLAGTGFLGLKMSTKKAHLIRAMLESLAFRIHLIFQCMERETPYQLHDLRVDGGVSQNDFLLQLLADLSGQRLLRPCNHDTTALGAALLVGLHTGVWESREVVKDLVQFDQEFLSNDERGQRYRNEVIPHWLRAVKRFKHWHSPPT